MRKLDILRCIEVIDAQNLLDFRHSAVCCRHRLLLLVDCIIHALFEAGYGPGHHGVHIRRLRAGTGNDQRRTRLIDENGIHLIDDGIVELALHHLVGINDHVIAQIIKTELIVRSERDIAAIRVFALREVHIMDDQSDRKAEEMIEFAHFFTVAAGQIIVDRDHMNALAGQRIEIYRQCRDQCLSFTGAHLRNPSLMQAHTADQLHIEMAHAKHAARALAHDRKRLRQQIIERLPCGKTLLKRIGIAG